MGRIHQVRGVVAGGTRRRGSCRAVAGRVQGVAAAGTRRSGRRHPSLGVVVAGSPPNGRRHPSLGVVVAETPPNDRRGQVRVAEEVTGDRRVREVTGDRPRAAVRREDLPRRGAVAVLGVAAAGIRPSGSPGLAAVDVGGQIVRRAAGVGDRSSDSRRDPGPDLVGPVRSEAQQAAGARRDDPARDDIRTAAVQGDAPDRAAHQRGVRSSRRSPADNQPAPVRRCWVAPPDGAARPTVQDDEPADRTPAHRAGQADGRRGARGERWACDQQLRRDRRPDRRSSHVPTARWVPGAGSGRRRGHADERNHRRPSCLLYPA